ncbi:hypothetical protein M9H77_22039 [Catharanthus roseus]|uniref:Uncharacterized protein n=1 Tax=Catharanthus roseus TaxID=4058 RepID=A0ACC0ATD3_CATRO|nr:hypothetical protein M9H77_22039 [Catharanthus roseus]
MIHKTDKDLSTIISHVKGARIVLERNHLASILGISDNGNIENEDYQPGYNNYRWDEKKKEWIPPSEKGRLRDCSAGGFQPIKKTTRSGIELLSLQLGKDDYEAEASDDEEDEAGAQNTI